MATNRDLPDLSTLEAEDLIDLLGETRQTLNHAKRMEAIYKEALAAKLSDEERELGVERPGHDWYLTATPESQMRFDKDAYIEENGQDAYDSYKKENNFLKMSIRRRTEEEKAEPEDGWTEEELKPLSLD